MADTLEPVWRLTVSDDVTAERDDGVTFVPGRKVAALLAYLAIERPTPRALLSDLLWPQAASARNSLRQAPCTLFESARPTWTAIRCACRASWRRPCSAAGCRRPAFR